MTIVECVPRVTFVKPSKEEKWALRHVAKIRIIWAFFIFIISIAEVTVTVYLSYLHFSHHSDIVAWLMLLPILLNFIGIFTFLSNKTERLEMESLGCKRTKNQMFFPVIGPSFAALRLFLYAFEEENAEKFERLESLLLRLKQYESYFRAAPEAIIQITYQITNWTGDYHFDSEDYWTTVCIILCIFTLAESHMYGCIIKYYRMFYYDPTEDAWRTEHIPRRWNFALFFFAFFSIGSRIFADAVQKAAAYFFFRDYVFGEVLVINFITEFMYRAGLYALYSTTLASPKRKLQIEDEGVYGAFTYSWRALFLSFDFQSYAKTVFCWFYIENLLMLLAPYILIYGTPFFGGTGYRNVLDGKPIYHVYVGVGVAQTFFAFLFKLAIRSHRTKQKEENKIDHLA